MPRIRTLKPEFWSSPGIGSISPWARLLFAAMWNWADDAGRGTCQLRELQGFAFPEDEASEVVGSSDGFRTVLAEVRGQFGVIFYKVKGRPYYAIPSFPNHQRKERMAEGRYPGPEEGELWDFMAVTSGGKEPPTPSGGEPRNFSASSTEAQRDTVLGTGEQGNRGTQPPSGAAATGAAPRGPSKSSTETNKRAQALTKAYTDRVPLSKFAAIMKIAHKAISTGLYDDDEIRDALERLAIDGRSVTIDTLRYELEGMPTRARPRTPNADDTIADLLAPTGTDAVILQLTRGEP